MYMCVCVCVCIDLLNVFHDMCAYKCTVHECMYVLCTTFHFHNTASVLDVRECVSNMVHWLFTNNAIESMCRCVHSCKFCNNSEKIRTQSHSKCYKPSLCLCACVCVCMCVHTGVYIHAHVHCVKTNKNPMWYKLRLCVHVCMCVLVCVCICVCMCVCVYVYV